MLQVEAANAYARISALSDNLYITEQTSNILRLRPGIFAAPILADTRTLKKARYLRRWARRLKEFSFSAEDAIVLAYGSFGVDIESYNISVELIVTTDLKLATRYNTRYTEIESRFRDMALNLPESYRKLVLPKVLTTANILIISA